MSSPWSTIDFAQVHMLGIPARMWTPDQLADALIALRTDERSFGNEELMAEVTNEGLKKLIRIAYYTSEIADENRWPRYRLGLWRQEAQPRRAIEFETPIALQDTTLLRRLAHACTTPRLAIQIEEEVNAKGEHVRLLCTGLTDLAMASDSDGDDVRHSFRIWTRGPGHIVAGDSIWQLELRAGAVRSIAPLSMFSPISSLVDEVASIAEQRMPQSTSRNDFGCNHLILDSLSHMLHLAIDKGHGGAFVILPNSMNTLEGAKIACKYSARGIDLIDSIRSAVIEQGAARTKAQSQLHSDIAALSELSAVDGCVVLTRDLKLLGFGGEIRVGEEESRGSAAKFTKLSGEIFERADNYESIMESFGGTRHRSAARLCRVISDVIVFVISQDGDLKMICNSEEGVYPYGPMDTRRMGASVD